MVSWCRISYKYSWLASWEYCVHGWATNGGKNQRRTSCDKLTVSEYEKAMIARSTSASGNEWYYKIVRAHTWIFHPQNCFNTAGSSTHKFKDVEYTELLIHEIWSLQMQNIKRIQKLSVVLLMDENCKLLWKYVIGRWMVVWFTLHHPIVYMSWTVISALE